MKISFAFSLAIALGSLASTAQGFGQVLSGPAINGRPLACPVGINAALKSGPGDEVAIDGARPKQIGQELHVTVTNSKVEEIAGIKITVHGSSGKGSLLSERVAEANSPQVTKTFDLKLTVGAKAEGAKNDASTDLWLSGFTAVSGIDLDAVTYADGAKWRSSALDTCHFPLDRATLISSR